MKTPKMPECQQAKAQLHQAISHQYLEGCLDATTLDNQDVESAWAALHETVYNTAMECLGPTTRKHKDWFDENSTEIIQLLEDKHHAYTAHLDDPKRTAKRMC